MQQTQNRIAQNDTTDLPTHVMVVEYRHKMDFSPSIKPRVYLMDKILSN